MTKYIRERLYPSSRINQHPLPEYPEWLHITEENQTHNGYALGWWCWREDYVFHLGIEIYDNVIPTVKYRGRYLNNGVLLTNVGWTYIPGMISVEQDLEVFIMESLL